MIFFLSTVFFSSKYFAINKMETKKNLFVTEGKITYENRNDIGLEIFLSVPQCCVCLVLEWGEGRTD